ncbi:hypothetical protein DEM27_09740 [Metarhizobium album]|uniref:Uncharacterized protein n=1 Tax=Metarhizobium album TaxID=2182425 RepID=A0A2U2DTM8_9HYPH|nr:hypothetical protein DEM27_09740 [Rhizobium album]
MERGGSGMCRGNGKYLGGEPGSDCRPDALVEAAGRYDKAAKGGDAVALDAFVDVQMQASGLLTIFGGLAPAVRMILAA